MVSPRHVDTRHVQLGRMLGPWVYGFTWKANWTPLRVRRLVVPDDIPSIWSMPLKHLKRLGRSENKTGIFPSLVIQQ